jgi:hypothetical protein
MEGRRTSWRGLMLDGAVESRGAGGREDIAMGVSCVRLVYVSCVLCVLCVYSVYSDTCRSAAMLRA